ncbi:hypothetical protein GL213_01160 [Halogeometricum borinquense]|uniref:Uncharacterized protein n=1 Tax=Halogeometricum borinquense TaxID=60847 RepID=A0A6C0UM27_9EURY|nr:hypothetical protein [Halogeometricum borinquense]QIB76297.1 hypothetical protein G3I44_19735 [Halogeometricum borinquense]QIQ75267.1 hypothetical protein GL213_01160 [Halogeometricum borinquense]
MKRRHNLLLVALVVLSAIPAAAAVPAVDSGNTAAAAAENTSAAAAQEETKANYTRLFIDAEDSYRDAKPGETLEYTVTVKNGEEESVKVNPHLVTTPMSEYPMEKKWVSIDGPSNIDAGETAKYTVSVEIPEDVETADYRGLVAFTDETVAYPGRPSRPIHATHLSADVWREPTVKILSDTYLNGQVKAGDSFTREVVIENTGDSAVPLSPEVKTERRHCRGHCPDKLNPSWIDIDSPSQVAAGEKATVSITVSPPENADRGRYDTEINLGLKDPNREEGDDYWQRIDANFVVWTQPSEPFETSFQVSEETDNLSLTLMPERYGADNSDEVNFDVEFVSPDGEVVNAERVRVTDSGHVDLGARRSPRAAQQDGEYAVRSGGQEFVYRVDEPAAGEWTLRVMPENTMSFQYDLTREEASEEATTEPADETANETSD